MTTVHARTYATAGATSVKERKLNARVTRKLPVRNVDNTFGPTLAASRNAADIICAMALDPYIGGRTRAELDVDQIYDTMDEITGYFGFPESAEFGYTFDDINVSFEEMVQTVAQSICCTAYRQGSILRLMFERETDDSILLFNHRNKLPGSETRTVSFGHTNDNDGVELDYVSGKDGAKLTLYIPADQSAVKAKKMTTTGIIDRRGDGAMAHIVANRAYNKIKYQNTATQFDAFGEATQLVLTQRIEVADNTRPDIFDGEVRDQDGLILELSQPFTPVTGVTYTIFLQLGNGTVQKLGCIGGSDEKHCVLLAPPSQPLITDDAAWALTTYQIVGTDNARPTAFLVSEKGSYDKEKIQIQAINYDARYYQNDRDFAGVTTFDSVGAEFSGGLLWSS